MKDYAEILYLLAGCGVGGILAGVIVAFYWKSKTVLKRDHETVLQESYRLNTQLAVWKEKMTDAERDITQYKFDLRTITDD